MIGLTDEKVWSSCLSGNKKAFAEIYRRYYSLLYNYGCKFSSDTDLIKDCIHNLFVKLIWGRETLAMPGSVKAYLLIVFRNHLYDTLKAQNERDKIFVSSMDNLFSFEDRNTLSDSEEYIADECHIIYLAFLELSSRQQEFLYMYYIMEASHADIARVWGINYQSSKNLHFRSLQRLKNNFFLKQKEYRHADFRESEDGELLFSYLTRKYNRLHTELIR